ncbi:hypothetical protein AAMO2058_001427600 [Amorphochlora amoebiformis]
MAALPLSLLAAVAFAARHSAPVNVLSEAPETSSGVPVANGSSVNLVETKNPQIVIFRPFPWFTPDFEFVIDCTRSTDPCVFEVGDIAGNTYCLTIGSNPRECLGPAGPTYPQTFVLPGGVSYEGNGEVTGTIPPSGVLETRINHQTGVPLTPREQCGSQISSCKIINDPHVTTFGSTKYKYGGTGEHILTHWRDGAHTNRITSCFAESSHRKDQTFIKSMSFTCKNTILIVQSSTNERPDQEKIRAHFIQNVTMLSKGHGDFASCRNTKREVHCTCTAQDSVTLVATSTRFKGEMFLNVNILSSTLARENLGGMCQSKSKAQTKHPLFISAPHHACAAGIPYPPHGPRAGHDAAFNDRCGPASWKIQKGPINVFAQGHAHIDECM